MAIPWNAVRAGYEAPAGSRCWCGAAAAVRCGSCDATLCQTHRWIHSHTSESMRETERLRQAAYARIGRFTPAK